MALTDKQVERIASSVAEASGVTAVVMAHRPANKAGSCVIQFIGESSRELEIELRSNSTEKDVRDSVEAFLKRTA